MLAGRLPFADIQAVREPYQPPEAVPADARPLLAAMLHPEPAQRATIQQICEHPWVQAAAALADEGGDIGIDGAAGEADSDVLTHMATQLGFERAEVETALAMRGCEESEAAAAYRSLLCAKRLFIDRCVQD
jgi:hypothetical protein